jgi:hypothetical protein
MLAPGEIECGQIRVEPDHPDASAASECFCMVRTLEKKWWDCFYIKLYPCVRNEKDLEDISGMFFFT